jgi:hypothetical protein
MGDIKLVKGPNGGEWTNHTNGTISVCEKKNGRSPPFLTPRGFAEFEERSFAKTGLGQTPGELTLKDGFSQNPFAGVACKPHCVFNLTEDESEHHDLAAARPDLLAKLLQRFAALTAEYHPPKFNPPADDAGCCAAAAANGNFLSPWTVAPPPPPPPPLVPLGSCIGAGKTPFLEPFRYKNDQFAKAGSG